MSTFSVYGYVYASVYVDVSVHRACWVLCVVCLFGLS